MLCFRLGVACVNKLSIVCAVMAELSGVIVGEAGEELSLSRTIDFGLLFIPIWWAWVRGPISRRLRHRNSRFLLVLMYSVTTVLVFSS
jgi:low temperature requirement protein LtrA